MQYQKLSLLQKWYLKYTDKTKYALYKEREAERVFFYDAALKIVHPTLNHQYKNSTNFKHSGNCGDIIYSLPAIYELSKSGHANIFLNLNQKGSYSAYHPLGDKMLNEKVADMLRPLLLYQSQIKTVEFYNGEAVDYDLDLFRTFPLLLDRGNISRWYFWVHGISHSLALPWLVAPKETSPINNYVVIARSHRYRNPTISYDFLNAYPNLLFIGVEEEYRDMQKSIPSLEFKKVNDFLEMATIINNCKLFIGNQSFPFAIAEGLKVNRLLEVYYKAPNVSPEGSGAYDFMFQPQFEKLTSLLYYGKIN
jgi:hypothetical protein